MWVRVLVRFRVGLGLEFCIRVRVRVRDCLGLGLEFRVSGRVRVSNRVRFRG